MNAPGLRFKMRSCNALSHLEIVQLNAPERLKMKRLDHENRCFARFRLDAQFQPLFIFEPFRTPWVIVSKSKRFKVNRSTELTLNPYDFSYFQKPKKGQFTCC